MDLNFHRLEIHPVRNTGSAAETCEDSEADMWCLYGFLTAVNGSEFAICVGDYPTREHAETIAELIGI